MARALRNKSIGCHYVYNKGVELRNIFNTSEDYAAFIQIVTGLAKKYDFHLHTYACVSHAYHMVVETRKKNISMIMKLINGSYSKYFNHKYHRSGYLWEGRYKSCFIYDITYLFYYIRYIEQLPYMMGATKQLDLYYYSSYRQFIGLDKCLPLLSDSIILKKFNTVQEIKTFFIPIVSKDEIEGITYIMTQNYSKENNDVINIKSVLYQSNDKNKNIVLAYEKGFSQGEIARELGVTQQAIYKRLKKYY